MSGSRPLHPLALVVIFTMVLALTAILVFAINLPSSLLIIPAIPLFAFPLYYDRRVYLPLLALLAACILWANRQTNGFEPGFLAPFLTGGLLSVILLEITCNVTQKRKQRELSLSDAENKYRRFFENSEDGFFLINQHGNIGEWNASMEKITGLGRASASGKPAWEILFRLVPEEQKSRANYEKNKASLQEMLQKGQIPVSMQTSEQQILSMDGTLRTVQQTVFPIETSHSWLLGQTMRDISDTHAEDMALRKTNDQLALAVKELERRNQEIGYLNEMGDLLQSSPQIVDTYAVFGQFASQIFPHQSGILYLLDNEHNLYEAVANWGGPVASESTFAPDACWTLRRGRVHIVTDPNNRLICPHLHLGQNGVAFAPYLCVPMTVQGETLGVLHIQVGKGQSIEELEQLAQTVAVRVGLTVANLRLRESLRVQSIRDPLTNLFNRRYMEETLERELHRAARHQLPLGVIMLDIDHFKHFNDTYGHEVGDGLLHELGAFFQANVRSEDVPCRYGGEEFIIILPEATLEDTCKRADQLHDGIHHLKIQLPDTPPASITVSQGVAGFPEHGASAGQLIRTVDAALYRAKRSGRDRIIVAEK